MIAEVAGRNLLEPWDDHIKGLDVEDFDKGIWSASVVNGKLYAMPHRGSTGVYFYNKTMFDEAGLAYPKEGWTYQDMLAMAKKITVPGQKYGVGIAASASDVANVYSSFAPVVWAHKGEFLSADNKKALINEPGGVAGITFWTELYTKHKVAPEGSINFSITKDVVPLFMNNKVALFPGSSAQFAMLAANPAVKWAPEVGPDGWNRGGGWALTLPVTSKNKAAAREYALWFVEPRNQSALMIRQPARVSATTAPPWNAPEYKPIFRAGKWARLMPNTPAWGEMSNVIINELQKILQGSKTPRQGADDMARQMNDIAAKK
jgi:multiple sugar transport system substrate-binding protein